MGPRYADWAAIRVPDSSCSSGGGTRRAYREVEVGAFAEVLLLWHACCMYSHYGKQGTALLPACMCFACVLREGAVYSRTEGGDHEGLRRKDKSASDPMEEACDAVKLPWLLKKAVLVLNTLEVCFPQGLLCVPACSESYLWPRVCILLTRACC